MLGFAQSHGTGTAAGFISAPPPQGGITFVAIKGVLKVYFRQQQYLLQADRRILDYLEPGLERGPAPPDEDSGTEGNLS